MKSSSLLSITAISLLLLLLPACNSQKDAAGDDRSSNTTSNAPSDPPDEVYMEPDETAGAPQEKTIPILEIEKGSNCGIPDKTVRVARDQQALDGLMKEVYSNRMNEPEELTMKFEEEIVVGVFMGEQTSGGYQVEIEKITEETDKIIIHIREKIPGDNCGTTDALTQPYVLLLFPATSKKIIANRTKETYSCE